MPPKHILGYTDVGFLAFTSFSISFSQNPGLVDQYLCVILGLEPNQGYAAMLGLLVQFCTSQKEFGVIDRYKASVAEGRW